MKTTSPEITAAPRQWTLGMSGGAAVIREQDEVNKTYFRTVSLADVLT